MAYTAEYSGVEPSRAEIDASSGLLLVEFGAPWCGYCRAVQATLADVMQHFPEVRHIKVHDSPGQPLGRSFRVKLWPNLVLLRDGKVLFQLARPSVDEIEAGFDRIGT